MQKLYFFILFIIIKQIKSFQDITDFDFIFPVAFTLINDNIIVFSTKGFFTFDSNFEYLSNYTFPTEKVFDNFNNKNYYPSFSQFSEEDNGYVFCLFLNYVYIFNYNGQFLNFTDANDISILNSDKNFVLNTYKRENDEYYYSIISYDTKLILFYYKINLLTFHKELIYNNTLEYNNEVIHSLSTICCQKMITNDNNNYLTCFYQIKKDLYYIKIAEISFEPDNNFSYIEPRKYLDFNSDINFYYAFSVNNEDNSKTYVCYTQTSSIGSCFYFDINNREFSNIHSFGYQCRQDLFYINLNYFRKTKEFIFSCVDETSIYSIIKFKENFTLIEPNTLGKYDLTNLCYKVKSFSIIYSIQNKEYLLYSSSQCHSNSGVLKLFKFNLTNYFNSIIIEETNIDLLSQNYNTNEITGKFESSEIDTIITQKTTIFQKCIEQNKIMNEEKNKCVCDNDNGYYSIKNNILNNDECYNNETIPNNFFLNEDKLYEMCHINCLKCNHSGNDKENNCTICNNDYIFISDKLNNHNCAPKCSFYYFFNIIDNYSCTKTYQCPKEASLLIRNKSKCIDNCIKDDIYKYQYSGECLKECPENTYNVEYQCKVKNIDNCNLNILTLNLSLDDIINNNIDSYTKNYVEEFNYTSNQIINYTNENYTLILYKNTSCIKELKLTVPQIDFGGCYEKIRGTYNITEDLLIAIIDKYNENENPITSYLLFNPLTGERINANEICKNEFIIMKENILSFPGINSSLVKFFADQNINVLNISDNFYKDICKHYKSPNEKDIPLNLRIKIFFPNISLCDVDCINKGIDLQKMESICFCPFNDLSKSSFITNTLKYNEYFDQIYSLISNSNIDVLTCISFIFKYEHFKRCIGGFIIIILFVFNIICTIIYFKKSKDDLRIYIYKITNSYEKSLLKDSPPKKYITKNSLRRKTTLNHTENKLLNTNYLSKYTNQIIIQNITDKKFIDTKDKNENEKNKKTNNRKDNNNKNKQFFKEYLATNPNEFDYDDVIDKDKRTFCEFFVETIKDKQLIINSFFIEDKIKHKSIKIIIFILNIDFYLLFNGLLYSEEILIQLYNINEETFVQFISRNFGHLIYIFIIMKVVNEFLDCFIIQEKKIRGIFIRGKKKLSKIKTDLMILKNKIEKYYIAFIIFSFIIILLSFFYISCFNDVYYYTRNEWIKSTSIIFIIIQIFNIVLSLIGTILRFISIKCKSEKIFNLSNILF